MNKGNKYGLLNYSTAYELIHSIIKKYDDFDKVLKEVFEIMGHLLGVDILELNIYDQSYTGFIKKQVWKRSGLESKRFLSMKSISFENSLFSVCRNYEYIKIDDTRKLDDEIKDFRKYYKMLHIKSLCVFPIHVNGETVAGIYLKHHIKRRKFTEEQIQFTKQCHQLIEKRFVKEYHKILLDLNKKNYLKIFKNLLYPLALIDYDFNLIMVNDQFESLFKVTNKELLTQDFFEFISKFERNQIINICKKAMKHEQEDYEVFKMIDTEKKMIRIIPIPINDKGVNIIAILFKDVTKYKMLERYYIKKANYDLVTGLHNRNYYTKVCNQLSDEDYHTIGIVVLDIDKLSEINRCYGYEKGNEVIKNVSEALKMIFYNEHLISRIGDDEFIVIILDQTKDIIIQKIKKLKNLVEKQKVGNCITIGYSFSNTKVNSIQEIVEKVKLRH